MDLTLDYLLGSPSPGLPPAPSPVLTRDPSSGVLAPASARAPAPSVIAEGYQLHPLAQEAREMIEATCYVHGGMHVGKPFRFEEFQLPLLDGFADPEIDTMVFSLGRKNGKTSVLAAIIPALMIGPLAFPNSYIICGAMARKQAAILYHALQNTITMSRQLRPFFKLKPSSKEVYCPSTGVTFFAISAEDRTAFGESPRIVIMDELGQVRGPTYPLYDALTTAQGAYEDAKMVIISTRPPGDGDLMNLIIDSAEHDPGVRVILYETPEDVDPFDERNWYAANPALGKFRSLKEMQKKALKAQRLPSFEPIFRNYYLNQKVDASAPFLSPSIWKSCLVDPDDFPALEDLFELPCFIGADLSGAKDLTAVAIVHIGARANEETEEDEPVFYVKMLFYMPGKGLRDRAEEDKVPYTQWADDGWINTESDLVVNYDVVARDLRDEVWEMFNVVKFGFDRWHWKHFLAALQAANLDEDEELFVPIGQGSKDMDPCIVALENAALEGRLIVEDNPVLNMCISNAIVTTDHMLQRKFDKSKAIRRIDGALALAMAVRVATDYLREEKALGYSGSAYDASEGLFVIG